MTFRRLPGRIARFTTALALSLAVLALLSVQLQQRLLRRHAEQLSYDMHQIRLYQTTWPEAQRLMNRWGAWGSCKGTCTPASCKYEITMSSIAYAYHVPYLPWLVWLLRHDKLNLYHRLGGRGEAFYASFTVHDGAIWRTGSAINVEVPTGRIRRDDEWSGSLTLSAESRQRLKRAVEDSFTFMGPDDRLAEHPYYKVGRPGGCMINCQIGAVYYSTHTPHAEIERLTSYNLSCLTSFKPCSKLEDLLPAAKDWHLYEPAESRLDRAEQPCDIPVWALARDARYVLSVDALSTKLEPSTARPTNSPTNYDETANVRIVASLKQPAPWPPGAIVEAYPFAGAYIAPSIAEHLTPGHRFILFPIGDDWARDRLTSKNPPIRLNRCGVQPDTAALRLELAKGFAQNDTLLP